MPCVDQSKLRPSAITYATLEVRGMQYDDRIH